MTRCPGICAFLITLGIAGVVFLCGGGVNRHAIAEVGRRTSSSTASIEGRFQLRHAGNAATWTLGSSSVGGQHENEVRRVAEVRGETKSAVSKVVSSERHPRTTRKLYFAATVRKEAKPSNVVQACRRAEAKKGEVNGNRKTERKGLLPVSDRGGSSGPVRGIHRPNIRVHAEKACLSAQAQTGVPARVLLAIAQVESGCNPRSVGDQSRSHGPFQIQARLHGLTIAQCRDWRYAAMWTAKRIKSWGRGVWYGVMRHNGAGAMARAYVCRVKAAMGRAM